MKRIFLSVSLMLSFASLGSAQEGVRPGNDPRGAAQSCAPVNFTSKGQQNIIQSLESAGDFKTLLRILKAAGLTEMLSRPDANITLFAPCDAAFAQWPNGKLDLMTRKFVKQLKQSLLNHMVAGRLTAQSLVRESNRAGTDSSQRLKTVGGEYLDVLPMAVNAKGDKGEARAGSSAGIGLRISTDPDDFNARSTTASRGNYVVPYISVVSIDIRASNGVIHVIDNVIHLTAVGFVGGN